VIVNTSTIPGDRQVVTGEPHVERRAGRVILILDELCEHVRRCVAGDELLEDAAAERGLHWSIERRRYPLIFVT
jgi:hypothetical protein